MEYGYDSYSMINIQILWWASIGNKEYKYLEGKKYYSTKYHTSLLNFVNIISMYNDI